LVEEESILTPVESVSKEMTPTSNTVDQHNEEGDSPENPVNLLGGDKPTSTSTEESNKQEEEPPKPIVETFEGAYGPVKQISDPSGFQVIIPLPLTAKPSPPSPFQGEHAPYKLGNKNDQTKSIQPKIKISLREKKNDLESHLARRSTRLAQANKDNRKQTATTQEEPELVKN
jgi:hypothetical protein